MISANLAVVIGVLGFLVLLVIGLPIGISLGLGSMAGIALFTGHIGLASTSRIALGQVDHWGLLAVPLFVFMGNVMFYHGIGEMLFDAVYKWVGWLKGGLAMVATLVAAIFGFACGSSTAAAAVVGSSTLPEMEKRKYNLRLSLGTLASAGGLAVLIPPSTVAIIYSLLAEASIGRVFIAGIIPGIILAFLYCFYIFIRAWKNPKLAPAGPRFPMKVRIRSLEYLVPVVLLFVAVIGGIYGGVWSAVEAGAGGAFIALIICLAYRRVTFDKLKHALFETVKICVFIYLIIMGANMLAYLFYITGFEEIVKGLVLGLPVPPWAVVVMMMLLMMILGMFLDVIALLTVCVPIFLPIVETLGYDPVWFGIVMIVAAEMALITPPVGVNLFVIKGIAPKDSTIMDVAIGAAPYVGLQWLLLGFLLAFPQLALWLPGMMIE